MGNRRNEETSDCYIHTTFQSLVQAIIPPTHIMKKTLGPVPVPGALEFKVYKYIIWILEHSIALPVKTKMNVRSMAKSTAELLDHGAVQLIQSRQNIYPLYINKFACGGQFSQLSMIDRLRAITLIERLEINLEDLSPPYQNNPRLIRLMMDVLNQLTMFGFYSEWTAYGTTAQFSPEYRIVDNYPFGWFLSRYPGPSFAYRDFRGFLAFMPHNKGTDEWRIKM